MTNHIQMATGIRKQIIRRFLLVLMVGVFGVSTTAHAMLPMIVLAMGGGGMMHGMMHGASGHGEKHDTSWSTQPGLGHDHADPATQRNAEVHPPGGDHDHNPGGEKPRPERTEAPTSVPPVQTEK